MGGLTNAGIHIHTGTDCTGGSDISSKDAVNKVIGGHLLYRGDGFLTTKYSSDADGKTKIDIQTPTGAYALLKSSTAATGPPAVEGHCIVAHAASGARIGIGKIVCTAKSCKASMGPYPMPAKPTTTTAKPSTTIAKPKPTTAANPKSTTPPKPKGSVGGLQIKSDKACIKMGTKSDVSICRSGPKNIEISGSLHLDEVKLNGNSLKALMSQYQDLMNRVEALKKIIASSTGQKL